MSRVTRATQFLAYPLLLIILGPLLYFSYKHPANNFDMVPYMGLILTMDGHQSMQQVHSEVYEELKKTVPAEDYQKLTSGLFRSSVYQDSAKYEQLLPAYAVKPLFIGCCYLFYKGGFSLARSTMLPSLTSFVMISLLLFCWVRKFQSMTVSFLTTVLFMYSSFSVELAGESTPDLLSALVLLTSFYFIIEKKENLMAMVFLLLACLIRPDNFVNGLLIVITFTYFGGSKKINAFKELRWFALMLGLLYVVVTISTKKYGWGGINFYAEFTSRYRQQAPGAASRLSLYWDKIVTAIVSSHLSLFLLLCLYLFGSKLPGKRVTREQLLLLALLCSILIRFILFPDLSDRFNFAFYVFVVVVLQKHIRMNFSQRLPAIAHGN